MGKSCMYYSDGIENYFVAIDNLVMAKLLFDLGKPLPEDYVFTTDTIDWNSSFFVLGIELLTSTKADILNVEGDSYSFLVEIPEAKQWKEILEYFPDASKDQIWFLESIVEVDGLIEEFTDTSVEIEFCLGSGFLFKVYGLGSYYVFFERFCTCYLRLQLKVAEWNRKRGEI